MPLARLLPPRVSSLSSRALVLTSSVVSPVPVCSPSTTACSCSCSARPSRVVPVKRRVDSVLHRSWCGGAVEKGGEGDGGSAAIPSVPGVEDCSGYGKQTDGVRRVPCPLARLPPCTLLTSVLLCFIPLQFDAFPIQPVVCICPLLRGRTSLSIDAHFGIGFSG